ncbi:MAG: RluA family pseudouridine synthase, partial [Lachnospiraceae bacterium]|nr:RluA family pseudouridine synthase [Lachnospiraceae bacterium]
DIIYEDKAVIVCHKAAGMAVQTARPGEKDMVSELKNYLSREKKGEPYVGIVHRLDQPVEGLIVFAKDSRTAAALSKQVQQGGGMHKEYLARVYGSMPADKGRLEDWMLKDKGNLSRIVSEDTAGAQKAVLEYERLETSGKTELLKILLHSGRHHQIRLQMSARSAPVLGDGRYGSEEAVAYAREQGIKRLCLIARKLEFDHPLNGGRKSFELDVML